MSTLEQSAVAAVERGEAWMDKHAPEDWYKRVNVTKLDINNAENCIMGQAYPGGYDEGLNWFMTNHKDMSAAVSHHGFACDTGGHMRRQWTQVIKARRGPVRKAVRKSLARTKVKT